MIDPDFHADDAEGGMRLGHTVVDIGAQGLQRYASLDFFLGASDLGSTQTSAYNHLDTLRAAAHGLLNCLLHGSAEGYALLHLLGDAAGHQSRVYLGIANLKDGETDFLGHVVFFGHDFERLSQTLYALTTLADHDSRLGGVNGDADLSAGYTLDLDARDAGVGQALHNELAQPMIFTYQFMVIAVGIPARLPALDDAEPEAVWINLMPQVRTSPASDLAPSPHAARQIGGIVRDVNSNMRIAPDDARSATVGANTEAL